MSYIRDYVIDVDLDPESSEPEIQKMQPQNGLDYNVIDRNIEVLIGED